MNVRSNTTATLLIAVWLGLALNPTIARQAPMVSTSQQNQDTELPKPVKRARRPKLNPRDWEGAYFENLFAEGLVGQRPDSSDLASAPQQPKSTKIEPSSQSTPNEPVSESNNSWSQLIPAEVLENEIKRIQIALEAQITTPVQFQTDYLSIRDTFSMLSMWMAVIQQYDGPIRWKDQAGAAQATFSRTAANCRVGSDAAYNSARNAQEKLRELVRGGTFDVVDLPEEDFSWAHAVDRNPIMRRLEVSLNHLKQNIGSSQAFKDEIEETMHDASLIAVMSRVIGDESMDDADDSDYLTLALKMKSASQETIEAIKLSNFEITSASVNKIEQSCNDCHADWR